MGSLNESAWIQMTENRLTLVSPVPCALHNTSVLLAHKPGHSARVLNAPPTLRGANTACADAALPLYVQD